MLGRYVCAVCTCLCFNVVATAIGALMFDRGEILRALAYSICGFEIIVASASLVALAVHKTTGASVEWVAWSSSYVAVMAGQPLGYAVVHGRHPPRWTVRNQAVGVLGAGFACAFLGILAIFLAYAYCCPWRPAPRLPSRRPRSHQTAVEIPVLEVDAIVECPNDIVMLAVVVVTDGA
jgi:hypothetical protein